MTTPNYPAPPMAGMICGNCKFHNRSVQMEFAILPNGEQAPADIVRQQAGGILPANMTRIVKSMCALAPNWTATPDEWWCWQWKGKGEGQ